MSLRSSSIQLKVEVVALIHTEFLHDLSDIGSVQVLRNTFYFDRGSLPDRFLKLVNKFPV